MEYNAELIDDILANPLCIFHEAMHFLEAQLVRDRRIPELGERLRPSLEVQPGFERAPTFFVIAENGFDPDSLKRHTAGIPLAAEMLRISILAELDAHFLTTAAWDAVARSQKQTVLSFMTTDVRRFPRNLGWIKNLELSLAQAYRPRIISAAFENLVVAYILELPLDLRLFVALARSPWCNPGNFGASTCGAAAL